MKLLVLVIGALARAGVAGIVKASCTLRKPNRGHFRRLSSIPSGKSLPRVHTTDLR